MNSEDGFVGKKFGHWYVIAKAGSGKYLCKCMACDSEPREVWKKSLKDGSSLSCGCQKNAKKIQQAMSNIEGKTFGEWTVRKYIDKEKCVCTCSCSPEVEHEVYIQTLRSGRSKSCGCSYKKKRDKHIREVYGDATIVESLGGPRYKIVCVCGTEDEYDISNLTRYGYKCRHWKGKKFGEWTVLEEPKDDKVLCRCSCGVESLIWVSSLTRGRSTKCRACRGKEQSAQAKDARLDLIVVGKTFGEWEVKEYKGGDKCLCECSCGTVREVLVQSLTRGVSKNCGDHKSLTGRKYGKLKVKERIPGTGKYMCDCDCGNKNVEIFTATLFGGRTDCGCEIGSKPETELADELGAEIRNARILKVEGGNPLEIDMYFKEQNIGIEFNGTYWHSGNFRDKEFHWYKTKLAQNQGIDLIHVFEYEMLLNKQRMLNFLNMRLGNCKAVNVNECETAEISNHEAMKFWDEYSVTGELNDDICIGLTHHEYGIVAAMSIRRDYSGDSIISSVVFGSCRIDGGAQILFDYFLDHYPHADIVAYCDRSKDNGEVYRSLGFDYECHTDSGYKWVSQFQNKINVLNADDVSLDVLIEKGLGDYGDTLDEIMQAGGYLKIYDCGSDKYVYRKEMTM